MQNETNETNPNLSPAPVQAKAVRVRREGVSQKLIDEINERHDRIVRSAAEIARDIIELGEMLIRVKAHVRHGKWLPFVEKNFHFTVRTAQRYMKAAERKYDPMLSIDPNEFMARVWGNEPKQLEEGEKVTKVKCDVTSHLDGDENDVEKDETDDDDDESQSGGAKFRGLLIGKDGTVPRILEPFHLKAFIADGLFRSPKVSAKEKLEWIENMIDWLQKQREVYTGEADQQEIE